MHELLAASDQFIQHLVEGQAEARHLVQFQPGRNAFGQVSATHLFGNGNHRPERFHNGGGKVQADPQRRDQQQDEYQAEDEGKADLQIELADAKLLIVRGRKPGAVDGVQHRPVDEPADKQIGVDKAVQLDHGTQLVRLVTAQDDDFALPGLFQPVFAEAGESHGKGKTRFGRHLTGPVQNDDFRQIAQCRLICQILVQQRRLAAKLEGLSVHVIGDGQDIAPDRAGMFLEIGVGDLNRAGNRGRDAVGEPATKRVIHDKQGKGRGDDRRQGRHTAKEQGEAPVELVAGQFLPPFNPQAQDLANDKGTDNDHRQHIDGNQGRQLTAVGLCRIELGKRVDRVDADRQRGQNRKVTKAVFRKTQQLALARRCLRFDTHRPDHIPSSRMRLRSVLRLIPRISAAFT